MYLELINLLAAILIPFLSLILFKIKKILIYVNNEQSTIKKSQGIIFGGIYFVSVIILNIFYFKIFDLNIMPFFLLIFLIGYFDDRLSLSPIIRIVSFVAMFSLIIFFENDFLLKNLLFTDNYNLHLGKYGFVFTILCFLLFINACNMADGINGLLTSLYIIWFFLLFINSLYFQNYFFLSIILSLIIFLFLNIKKEVYLGDSGNYLITSVLALLTIKTYNYNSEFLRADIIFSWFALPGIDMLRLFFQRIINKKSPFKPDFNHLHHYLIQRFNLFNSLIIYLLICVSFFILFAYSNLLFIFNFIICFFIYFLLLVLLKNVKKKI